MADRGGAGLPDATVSVEPQSAKLSGIARQRSVGRLHKTKTLEHACVASIACLVLAALPLTGFAQDSLARVSIGGIVRDTSGRPLTGAEVRSGEHFTVTSDSGTFLLTDLMPDTVDLLVRRIGYKPVSTAFAIRPGYHITVAVKMTPSSVTLGTVVVEGKRMDAHLWKAGFYERSKLGMGTFFTPEYLEHHGSTVSGLIGEVPSVMIARDLLLDEAVQSGGVALRLPVIHVTRASLLRPSWFITTSSAPCGGEPCGSLSCSPYRRSCSQRPPPARRSSRCLAVRDQQPSRRHSPSSS